MMLWVSCLMMMIGSITCSPIQKAAAPAFSWHSGRWMSSNPGSSFTSSQFNPRSNKAELPAQVVASSYGNSNMAAGYGSPGSHFSGSGLSLGQGGSSSLPSQDVPHSPGSYGSAQMAEGTAHNGGSTGPAVNEYGFAFAASQTGGYDGSYNAGYGGSASAYEGDSAYAVAPGEEDWSSWSAGSPEPVFSDVSDLEPVFSFSSRSRYQRGRAMFAQTRYTPGEPVFPPMPLAGRSEATLPESSPADTPTKTGF